MIDYYQQYKKIMSGRQTKGKRKKSVDEARNKKFLCYDGETLDNKYVLLGNSEDYIYDENGLSGLKCFNFLIKKPKEKATRVIFNLHFDIQFWIKDMSDEDIIRLLCEGEKVWFYDYELFYVKNKFLKIHKRGMRMEFTIYDFMTFFRSSLLHVIKNMQIELTDYEKMILEKGKTLRGTNFENMSTDEVISYNQTECVISEKICEKLHKILFDIELEDWKGKKFNLVPAMFYGSGAVAKKILQKYNFREYSAKEKFLTKELQECIYKTYYGGRAECFKIGTFKNVYKYDINSAYPTCIKDLREIISIDNPRQYKQSFGVQDGNIYYIEFDFRLSNDFNIGVLPVRAKDGAIFFPLRGKGWYWGIEVKHFLHFKKVFYKIKYEICFSYGEKIFNGIIEDMFSTRLLLKKQKNVAEIAYKLSLNSMYGKMGQTRFISKNSINVIAYASYITAFCRGMVYDAIIKNDLFEKIIFISTDGILVQKKCNLDTGEKLGQWEEDYYVKAVVLGSGVYHLIKTGDGSEKDTDTKFRSFNVEAKKFFEAYEQVKKKGVAVNKFKGFIGHVQAIKQKNVHGVNRLKFIEIEKKFSPFEYMKRHFTSKNLNKTCNSRIVDIYQDKEFEESYILKTLENIDYELDAIETAQAENIN